MALILVIDDEQALRDIIRQILEGVGHRVIEARHGGEGLLKFQQQAPALVISDIIMPEQNGVEMVARLRAERPDVPIIAISGGGRARMLDLLDVAKDAGATMTLTKPFRKDELLAAVDHLVDRPPSA